MIERKIKNENKFKAIWIKFNLVNKKMYMLNKPIVRLLSIIDHPKILSIQDPAIIIQFSLDRLQISTNLLLNSRQNIIKMISVLH